MKSLGAAVCGQVRLPVALLLLGAAPAVAGGIDQEIAVTGVVSGPARALIELVPLADPHRQGGLALRGELGPEREASATVGDDGAFRIVAPRAAMWRLRVSAPGHVGMEYPLVPLTDEVELPAVELPRDAGLEVRALDPAGSPVSGARFLVRPYRPLDAATGWRPQWQPAPQLAVTGPAGRATLPARSGDSMHVEVLAVGFLPAAVTGVRQPRLDVRLRPAVPRRFRVRGPGRRPLPGAVAWLDGMDLPAGASDAEGWLSLDLPQDRRARLRLLDAGGASLETTFEPPAAGAPPKAPPVFDLAAPVTLAGRVIGLPARRPLAGAIVWTHRDFASAVRTDATGGFRLALLPGSRAPLRAAAGGYFEETVEMPPAALAGPPGPVLALSPQSFLVGSVVDPAGSPLAAVEVRARYDTAGMRLVSPALRRSVTLTRTGAAGRFRVGGLAPGVTYVVRFAKPGFAPRILHATAGGAGAAPEPLAVVLTPGATATGLVQDLEDQAVAGAVVELHPSARGTTAERIRALRDPDPALGARAVSGADGRFVLRDLPAGRFDLAAAAPGFAAARVPGVTIPEGRERVEIGIVILEPEQVVTGRVQERGGRPVEGAAVRIAPADPLEAALAAGSDAAAAEAEATTDAAGWFHLRSRRRGERLDLSVERHGYATAALAGITVPLDQPLVVTLAPASRVAGRVVDGDARALAGIPIDAVAERAVFVDGGLLNTGRVFSTVSGADGGFVFEAIEPGRVKLTASPAGWQEATLDLAVPEGGHLEGVELVLLQAASVAGQVLGPDGSPAVGAEIGRHEPAPPGVTVRLRAPLARTDGDGRYRIEGLAPAPLALEATHPASGRAVADLAAEPGENRLDFQLAGGRALAGHVVDSAAAPVAGAAVRLRSGAASWTFPQVLTGSDGGFRFEGLEPGDYALDAAKPGAGKTREPVPVSVAEAPVEAVLLELDPTGVIHGRILGLALEELGQVRLVLGWLPAEAAEVGYDGTYSISDVPPGTWRVAARLPRSGRQAEGEVAVDPGAGPATLDLDFGSGLALRGLARRNGSPLAGATVVLSGSGLAPASAETDAGGAFAFHGLQPDSYRLELSDFRTGLSHARSVELREDLEVVLDLETGAIAGRVLDARERRPLGRAEVTLTQVEGDLPGPGSRSALSAADGTFAFSDVVAGAWRLAAGKAGFATVERVTSVEAGERQDLEIPLEPAAGLTLTVRSFSLRPAGVVYVAALDPAGRPAVAGTYQTDPEGRLRLQGLAAGTWQLVLGAPGAATVEVSATAPGGETTVVLPRGGELYARVPELVREPVAAEGLLRDPGGRVLRQVGPGGLLQERWPLRGGEVHVSGIPHGAWQLDVVAADGRAWSGQVLISAGQSAELELGHDEGRTR